MLMTEIDHIRKTIIDHNVNLIEEYFNEIGIEFQYSRSIIFEDSFHIIVVSIDEYFFWYEGLYNKENWTKENPIHLKKWSFNKNSEITTFLLKDTTFKETLKLYNNVKDRNLLRSTR